MKNVMLSARNRIAYDLESIVLMGHNIKRDKLPAFLFIGSLACKVVAILNAGVAVSAATTLANGGNEVTKPGHFFIAMLGTTVTYGISRILDNVIGQSVRG